MNESNGSQIRHILLLLLLIKSIHSFNLDVASYIRYEGPSHSESMFGFSVALHQEQQRSWVIVGAPKADTSHFQKDVINGGAVYRCDISDDNRCQIIPFDSNSNNINERNEQIDTKSNQWFGATVSSAGIDGPLVACAPRYVYHQHNPSKAERIEPIGTCFIAKDNFREYQEFSPCRTIYWGYHRQGSCQAGLSAAVNKVGDRVFIGAPGSWYWQGQVYSINTDAVFPYKPPRYGQFGDGGQMYSFTLNNPKDKIYSTSESSSQEDDSYLGYSSTTGDFTGEGIQGVAVGMPRGAGHLGKVLVFSWNLTNQLNITGEQIGAYFGYSLCSIDVDGDKLDDLIIGAPMYTEPNNEGKYETGRVYIVYQNRFNKFKELETREGTTSKGRFGLSLAALGDINLDGYGDFAVGAPYDGKENRGAVYIFLGSKDGPLKKASQVIYAEDIWGTQLTTFGFSVAGGIDLDGNQYKDMVVGAYESNLAIVLKSRAVAMMEASTVFNAENKLISLESKNCTVGVGRKQYVTCTTLTSCLKYNGINLPSVIDVEILWILDSKKPKTPRMYFINEEGKNVRNLPMRLTKGKPECRTETVYISDTIQDKLTPLEVEMKYSIRQSATSYTSSSTALRRRRATLDPILDETRGTVQRDSINIMKNCGMDNICIPDIKLNVRTNDKFILGGKEPLTADVSIYNDGEDAFETAFYFTIPPGLNYQKGSNISCTNITTHTYKCDIGNPLATKKEVNFQIEFQPLKKAGVNPFYDFYMEVNSTNEEAEGGRLDNIFKKSVSITVEPELSIGGNSQQSELHYNVSEFLPFKDAKNESEIGPQVVHIFDIRNNGTTSIEEIELLIQWPAMTLDDEPLMYLLNEPETQGNIRCEPSAYINEHRKNINYTLAKKSFLNRNRASIRTEENSSALLSNKLNVGRYNNQDQQILDSDNSEEAAGEASYVSKSRSGSFEKSSGSWQNHQEKTAQRVRVSNANKIGSQIEQAGGGRGNFNWNSESGLSSNSGFNNVQNSGSSTSNSQNSRSRFSSTQDSDYNSRGSSHSSSAHQGSSGLHSDSRGGSTFYSQSSGVRDSSSSDLENESRANARTDIVSRGNAEYDSQKISNSQRNFNRKNIDSSSQSHFGDDALNRREHEYREEWNTRSVNGGPAITHYSSKNQTFHRGNGDKRVLLSETSTETIVTGGIGRINEQEKLYKDSSRNSGSGIQGSSISYESGYSRQNGGHGSRSRSSQSAWNTSSGSRSDKDNVNLIANVDQDISSLAERTYSAHENDDFSGTSSHSGRRRMMSQQDGEPLRPGLVTGITPVEKAAQGGHGFQVVGLDLGTFGGHKRAEDEVKRNQSTSTNNQISNGSSYNSQHSFNRNVNTVSSDHYSINQNLHNDDDQYEDVDDFNEYAYDDVTQDGGSYNSQSSYSTRYTYKSNKNNPELQHYRKIRDITAFDKIRCSDSVYCLSLKCVVGPLDKGTEALIALRTRLVAHTLHKLGGESEVKLSTMAYGKITKLPFIGAPENETIKSHEIFVTATPNLIPKADVIPLWIFVLAACVGALILLLLIYLLYKCGFFKRNRPTSSPHERQPLNRNGNYHGDEHL